MKKYTLLLAICFIPILIVAQSFSVRIGSGGHIKMNSDNVHLVLTNTNLENAGTFHATEGRAIIRGNIQTLPSKIGGSGITHFAKLEIDKTNNETQLIGTIEINQDVIMTSNNLDLQSHNLLLVEGTDSKIIGESSASCIYSSADGEIIKTVDLNAPNGQNPAGLGLAFTSNDNLGITEIRRGHQVEPSEDGLLIKRYYDINPTNSNAMTDLEFHYLEGELGTLNEDNLILWTKNDNTNWTRKGILQQDINENSIHIENVSSAGIVTLGSDALFVSPQMILPSIYDANTGLMSATLTAILPNIEPYSMLGHMNLQNEAATATFPNTTAAETIVDWVIVELRDPITPSNIVASRAALLQRDGDIVDVDTKSPVAFEGLSEGNYHIAVRHRNHLGTMTANPVLLAY